MLTFSVRCMNHIHKIVLADNGQLCLCDHQGSKERAELRALQALGSDYEARCIQVLDLWRRTKLTVDEYAKFPSLLAKLHKFIHADVAAYRLAKKWASVNKRKYFDFSQVTTDSPVAENRPRYVLEKTVEELTSRGWAIGYEMENINWHKYHIKSINTNSCYVYFDNSSYVGDNVQVKAEGMEPTLIMNSGLYVKVAADLAEWVYFRMLKNRWVTRLAIKANDTYRNTKTDKYLDNYPGLQAYVSAVNSNTNTLDQLMDPLYMIACRLKFTDPAALAIYLSEMNKTITRLTLQKRVIGREIKYAMLPS